MLWASAAQACAPGKAWRARQVEIEQLEQRTLQAELEQWILFRIPWGWRIPQPLPADLSL